MLVLSFTIHKISSKVYVKLGTTSTAKKKKKGDKHTSYQVDIIRKILEIFA